MRTPTKKKIQEAELAEQVDALGDVTESTSDLKSRLEHVKSKEGVTGYILRAPTSASVDIKDPSKIIDYAVLSSTTIELAESLSLEFSLGKINSILLEGKDAKVLSMTVGEQQLSVFMEKSANHNLVYKDLK